MEWAIVRLQYRIGANMRACLIYILRSELGDDLLLNRDCL
jgi:hypothetical protein